LNRF